MVFTKRMKSNAKWAMAIITTHTVFFLVSSLAHEKIDIFYSIKIYMPMIILFCLAPLALVFTLMTKYSRQSSIVLLGLLPSSMIYTIFFRFTSISFIMRLEPLIGWRIVYEVSFGIILLTEAIGFWLIFRLLQDIHRQIDKPKKRK
jgi:hypothetical protein